MYIYAHIYIYTHIYIPETKIAALRSAASQQPPPMYSYIRIYTHICTYIHTWVKSRSSAWCSLSAAVFSTLNFATLSSSAFFSTVSSEIIICISSCGIFCFESDYILKSEDAFTSSQMIACIKLCYISVWNHLMRWLRIVNSLKSQVSFAKEPYKRDYILQKRPIIFSILLTVATQYVLKIHCVWTSCPRAPASPQSAVSYSRNL